jgi:hypothetical protein
MSLDDAAAARLARVALGHVAQEWPQKLDHVLTGTDDLVRPALLHPVFHGSFDWHSCVHAHWLLARVLTRFPDGAMAAAIRARFDAAFTGAGVAAERAYLARPSAAGFERPYGWAWLLQLQVALEALPEPRWAATLAPLAADFGARFSAWLPRATYPVRAGTHASSAFALCLGAAWAERHAPDLRAAFEAAARRWFGADRAAQAWEPSGEDFLSPTLTEAACMARLLPAAEFAAWRDAFLPGLADRVPAALFSPAEVSDRSDGRIVHLDGLNLSRAWCWRMLAATYPADDPRRGLLLPTAQAHRDAAWPHLDGHYMGAHWLASFALLAEEGAA